jgi:hypothetical protein
MNVALLEEYKIIFNIIRRVLVSKLNLQVTVPILKLEKLCKRKKTIVNK